MGHLSENLIKKSYYVPSVYLKSCRVFVCSFVRSLRCCVVCNNSLNKKENRTIFSKYFIGAHHYFTADRAKSHIFERFF